MYSPTVKINVISQYVMFSTANKTILKCSDLRLFYMCSTVMHVSLPFCTVNHTDAHTQWN